MQVAFRRIVLSGILATSTVFGGCAAVGAAAGYAAASNSPRLLPLAVIGGAVVGHQFDVLNQAQAAARGTTTCRTESSASIVGGKWVENRPTQGTCTGYQTLPGMYDVPQGMQVGGVITRQ